MTGGDDPRLLLEVIAARTGLDRLAERLGYPDAGPYLVVLSGVVLDFVVLSGISWVVVGRETYISPLQASIPVGLCIAVWLTRRLQGQYRTAIESLPDSSLAVDDLATLPSRRLQVGLLVLFYVGHLVQLLSSPAEVANYVALHGQVFAWAKYLFVSPFYFLVFADIAALLAAALALLPWRLYSEPLTLDFSDVHGFAGIYEVSRLLQRGAMTYYLALTAWTVVLYLPQTGGSNPEISTVEAVLFPALWLFGVVLFVAPVYLLHRRMVAAKADAIDDIDAAIRDLDPEGQRRGLPYLSPREEDIPKLQQRVAELQQVRAAREYPVNVTILEEFAFAAVLPLCVNWLLTQVGVGSLV